MSRNRAPVDYVSEVDSQESESESESEAKQLQKKSEAVKTPLPPSFSSSSSEEDESETEQDSDSSKTMEEEERTKQKRPREEKPTPTEDVKKMKKADPEKKTLLFQRVWSEEDEIVILRGMVEYWSGKKSDPMSDLNDFHEFIKKDLHINVSRGQLKDKIRRLKKKYENNKNRGKQSFSKSHEQKSYDLSSKIWGMKETEKMKGLRNLNEKVAVVRGGERESFGTKMEESMMKDGRDAFEEGKGVEGEDEWEELKKEEMKYLSKFLDIRVAQTRLVLKAMATESGL